MAFQSLLTSRHQKNDSPLDHTPSSAVTGGNVVNLGGSVFGWADRDISADDKGAVHNVGIRRFKKSGSSGPTFSVGDSIVYDSSASLHIALSDDHDPSADYVVGICVEAAGASQDYVLGYPLLKPMDRYGAIQPFVYEFDTDGDSGDADTTAVQLIPAWMNRHGLVFVYAFGIVTEAFAGDIEDQGVVTIEDTDGTDICTLTPTNGGADDVGDIILSNISAPNSATGTAWKTVTAGKGVQGLVTQETDGSATAAAGKMRVYTEFRPLY